MRVGILQLNATVGDFSANQNRLLAGYQKLVGDGADLVVAPELYLSGYVAQDFFLREDFLSEHDLAHQQMAEAIGGVPLIMGLVERAQEGPGKDLWNGVGMWRQGKLISSARKNLLPTYDVFDEDRYFRAAESLAAVEVQGKKIGLSVCEDIWNDADFWSDRRYRHDPIRNLAEQGLDLLINVSASPWHFHKDRTRLKMLQAVASREKLPLVQVNLVGGNDELVFDGQSLALSSEGEVLALGNAFTEDRFIVDLSVPTPVTLSPPDPEAQLFYALAMGVRDYVGKCGFQEVVIGLSGGIDSAVTAAVAVEALGPDRVTGVLMPTSYSSKGSVEDAVALAEKLEIATHLIPIQETFESLQRQMKDVFADLPADLAEENMQSRLRGVTLMSLANKFNRLVLTTGNKSEMAVGYATLYGDMCGALGVLSDVWKTQVYDLARWINRSAEIIPANTIDKPPSAELREDQKDEDSLPPYEILDAILQLYVVEERGISEILAAGHDRDLVRDVLRKVDLNEYKRRQAAPGIKVSPRAFGIGRRRPVAHRFHPWKH